VCICVSVVSAGMYMCISGISWHVYVYQWYQLACICVSGVSAGMYMCISGISWHVYVYQCYQLACICVSVVSILTLFLQVSKIGFWNCSDDVIYFVFIVSYRFIYQIFQKALNKIEIV